MAQPGAPWAALDVLSGQIPSSDELDLIFAVTDVFLDGFDDLEHTDGTYVLTDDESDGGDHGRARH